MHDGIISFQITHFKMKVDGALLNFYFVNSDF